MIHKIEKIDLPTVVEAAGIALQRRGDRHIGLCPFHSEKTPSFVIFPGQHQRYRCFGCGESGDCVDFIQKIHGLSFQDALKHLGLHQATLSPAEKRKIQAEKAERDRKRALMKKFQDWQARYADELGILIRSSHKVLSDIKNIDDLEERGIIYHGLERWKYHLWLLIYGDDEARRDLFKEVGDRDHNPGLYLHSDRKRA